MIKRKNKSKKQDQIGKIKIVKDFLPPPEKLFIKPKSVKVTLILNQQSVDFFKEIGQKEHIPYQKLIRVLLDKYASQYR